MKDLTQYKEKILSIFKRFLDSEIPTIEDLIIELCVIEAKIDTLFNHPADCSLWWRYFKDDTLATTIANLFNDLKSPTNKQYAIDSMKIAVETKELEIFYS